MTVGERALDPEKRRLVEDAACAVSAAQLAAFDLQALGERVIGLVQQVYWDGSDPGQCAPPTVAISGRKAVWCVENGCLDLLWLPYERPEFDIELPPVDVHGDPALRRTCGALVEHIVAADAHDLVSVYFGALARRLRDAAGVPATGEDPDGGMVSGAYEPVAEQLTADERQAWASRGWIELDPEPELHPATVLYVRTGAAAGIYRRSGRPFATTRISPFAGGHGLDGPVTLVGGTLASTPTRPGCRLAAREPHAHHARARRAADGARPAPLPHRRRARSPLRARRITRGSITPRP